MNHASPSPAPNLSPNQPIAELIKRAQHRLRTQRAVAMVFTAGTGGLLLVAIALLLFKFRIIPSTALLGSSIVAAVAVVLSVFAAALRTVRPRRILAQIDASHHLHDRLRTAYEFSKNSSSLPNSSALLARAAIEDAEDQSTRVELPQSFPWKRPPYLRSFMLALVLLALAVVIPILAPRNSAHPPAITPSNRVAVAADLLESPREFATDLQAATNDPELKRLAQQLNELYDKLENKALSPKQLYSALAKIEQQIRNSLDHDMERLLKHLREIGASLKRKKPTEDLGHALERNDLLRAKKELDQLAKKLQSLNQKSQRKLAQALAKSAKTRLSSKQLEKRIRQIKKHLRRLKRDLQKNPNNKRLTRRLARNRRQLERLNQRRNKLRKQQRQLQRLNDQLSEAAAALLSKLPPKALEALRKAAQQMQQFAQQKNRLQKMRRAQDQLQDLKDLIRRLQSGGKLQIVRMQQFMQRAGGNRKNGKGNKGKGKDKGKDSILALSPGGMGGTPIPIQGQPGGQKQGSGQQAGDGQGDGIDPNLQGDRTKLNAKRKDVFVKGKQNAGPTHSQVILGAAERGFSERSYKRVYRQYNQIIEDVMKREQIPLGYRYYVKRYFELIKPR